ncbi:DUF1289 domain-containing protein [Aliiruegeria sabulilitoris]|uniref:DUF1289 domain-containing protein n=1 Tax=Aliiruegeria sabulilitoris TaxID=1510458 RepID=UPI00082CD6D5|nr:DUF1289 domain-containing protein [Aliiruegeria sabulilitoris]NDR58254.1 DUF1289 domain-containing protein [Pseudoruegeria sp. M32A2M]
MSKLSPSPCIDICKYTRRGHCVGCSMTQAQKRLFGGLKSDAQRREFIDVIRAQQELMGRYEHWPDAYRLKCARAERQTQEGS